MPVFTVTTTASEIASVAPNGRHSVHVRNNGSEVVYVANRPDVSTSDYDVYLDAGDAFTYDRWDGTVWAVASSGSQSVSVEEEKS